MRGRMAKALTVVVLAVDASPPSLDPRDRRRPKLASMEAADAIALGLTAAGWRPSLLLSSDHEIWTRPRSPDT